jgi:hypothetical protein
MELIILSIKGDATAVRYVFVFITIMFLVLGIFDLIGSYNKAPKIKNKWSFPKWYIYPFLFWFVFLAFDIIMQNKVKESNQSDISSQFQPDENVNDGNKSENASTQNSNQIESCTEEQRDYLTGREKYWQEYRNSGNNELLSDEAHERFINYCNSNPNIKNWRGEFKSVYIISDGTAVIDLKFCNKPITLLVSNVPESVIREMREGVTLVFSGIKNYDRLNGEFLKGSYNSGECRFTIEN